MKKILLVTLLVAGTVFAGNKSNKKTKDTTNSIKGLYVGAGLQYSRTNSQLKATNGIAAGNPIVLNKDIARPFKYEEQRWLYFRSEDNLNRSKVI